MPRRHPLEKDIEQPAVKAARAAGWQSLKADKLHRGWSDQVFFRPSPDVFMVEFKAKGEKPRKQQEVRIAALRAKGFRVDVIDNLEDFKTLLHRRT